MFQDEQNKSYELSVVLSQKINKDECVYELSKERLVISLAKQTKGLWESLENSSEISLIDFIKERTQVGKPLPTSITFVNKLIYELD